MTSRACRPPAVNLSATGKIPGSGGTRPFPGSKTMSRPSGSRTDALRSLLDKRIAILDGAMGTMVHALGLDEA